MTGKGSRYKLTLRAIPEADAPPDAIRLRRALKCLLRSWGLRCERIEEVGEESSGSELRFEERR